MSLGWKITCWSFIILMVLGSLDLIGTNQFQIIHLIGVGFVISISIKCLELGKEVENLKARNNKLKNKDSSITLN